MLAHIFWQIAHNDRGTNRATAHRCELPRTSRISNVAAARSTAKAINGEGYQWRRSFTTRADDGNGGGTVHAFNLADRQGLPNILTSPCRQALLIAESVELS